MLLAHFPKGAIPKPGKEARRFGVADSPVRPSKAVLEKVLAKGVDDAGGVIFRHRSLVPNYLAQVKPNERVLKQISWRGIVADMLLSEKPYGDIAERIRWHRALEGMEQKEYAEKAGLKRSQLSNWESGDYRLSLDGARALRVTYGLSLDFMFEGIDDALPMTLRAAWRDRPAVK
jgi:DNA-binding XRE family transcriptional regulator